MAYIPYDNIEIANQRSLEMWEAVLGRVKHQQDITEFLYGRRERTGDPESDEGLPVDIDYAIVVSEQDETLDGLIRADDLTADEIGALLALYDAWEAGVSYLAGDLVTYADVLYEVIQAHNSQSDWTPDIVPALFVEKSPPGVIPEWSQPAGAHDAYNLGDKVTYNGEVWESTINANVWAPGVYGWVLV